MFYLRVGASPDCKMPIDNLSKVFGPTIIGYSCSDPDPETLLSETRKQVMVGSFCFIVHLKLL